MAEPKTNNSIHRETNEDELFSLVWLHHDNELDDCESEFVTQKLLTDVNARHIAKMASDVSSVVGAFSEVQPPQSLRNAILASTTRQGRSNSKSLLRRLGQVLLPTYRSAIGGSAAAALLVAGVLTVYHHQTHSSHVSSAVEAPSGAVKHSAHDSVLQSSNTIASARASSVVPTVTMHMSSASHVRSDRFSGVTILPSPRMRLHLQISSGKHLPQINRPVVALATTRPTVVATPVIKNDLQPAVYARQEDLNQPMLSSAVETTPMSSTRPTVQLVVSHSPISSPPPVVNVAPSSQTIRWQPAGGQGDSMASGNHPGGVVMVNLPARSAQGIYAPVVLDTLRHGEAGLPISLSHF